LQTSHVSVTGLKWLELLPSIFCRLIGTDNTPNPFLQTLMKLPGHPVRTGQARRGRSTDLSALSMSKGLPGTQWRTECEPMKFHFYCAPLTPPTCLPQAGKAGFAGHLPVRSANPKATEEGRLSKFSQSSIHHRKKLLRDTAASQNKILLLHLVNDFVIMQICQLCYSL
jgi:hypothetical protein